MVDAATIASAAMMLTATTVFQAGDTPARQVAPVPLAGGAWRHTQIAEQDGRLVPKRIPAAPRWRCEPYFGGIRCVVSFTGPSAAWRANVTYTARARLSRTIATVRP